MLDAQSDRRDLLVVGCGIADLSAAVAAAERGLSVAVLERAPVQDFGGNTRWTESYLRMKNEQEVSDDFEASLAENAGANLDPNLLAMAAGPYKDWPPFLKAHGMPDPELVSTFAGEAGPTLKWLRKFGIKFDALASYLLTTSAPRIMPIGGGLAMIEALHRHASGAGVDFHYETSAYELLRDEAGAVTGALDPPKSNWARPLEAAPYLAYPIISSVCFTFGGLKVDSKARVLDGDGRPIKGLFAAGETVGLYYQVYTGATSVLKGAVFGRLAGSNAAAA